MAFVHLHVHSDHSLLDGAAKLESLVLRARELGMHSLALTDHGNLHGAVEFYHLCLKNGIKPILGMEAYVAPGSRFERSARHGLSDAAHHLILLARDDQGWQNLIQLSSIGYLQGFYYRPRVDKEVLKKHAAGLIALSGCLSGEIPSLILKKELPLARQVAEEYREIFGPENFYLEMQDHGIPDQRVVNRELRTLSLELGIPLVATNDLHYLTRDMAEAHDVLLCIQTGARVDEAKRMRFEGEEFYLKSPAEMTELFAAVPEAVENTLKVAERCNLALEKPRLALPKFGEGLDEDAELESLCRQALPEHYPGQPVEALQRMEHELQVIRHLGFSGYFLTVRDFIHFARSKGIRVGPGRGSAAGSLVSYVLGITRLDPLKHGLLFERFLNPERVSPPDIDVDFADDRREEVIAYVTEKYGRERVAGIITFGTLSAKAVVRDVGRVLDYSYGETDAIAKMIPFEADMTLELALERSPELAAAAKGDARVGRLLGLARKLEGLARNASKHAAGVVISPVPLIERVPLCLDKAATENAAATVVTQFDMGSLEKVGLVKMDFLGLRTLRILETALGLIQGAKPDIDHLPDADPEAFAMLAAGHSHGIFQLESPGMRDLLKRFKPRCLEDLDQLIALYRPGPMRMIDEYLRKREGKEPLNAPLPELLPLLKNTCGVILYQEQVMTIAVQIGGLSLAKADLLRRAMSKKDPELLEGHREEFCRGAKAHGLGSDKAGELFDLLARFAEYGFNKSHSACYALVAYQTAWLKAHYPAEFLCALMSAEAGNADKVVATLAECRRLGLSVAPPDVNESGALFTISGGKIRFGLAAIKNVGVGAMELLLEDRKKAGPFKDMRDLLSRVDPRALNTRMVESLIKAGALDSLYPSGYGRAKAMADLPQLVGGAARMAEDRMLGQGSLFGDSEGNLSAPVAAAEAGGNGVAALANWSDSVKLGFEKEMLGFYVTGHPLGRHERLIRALRPHGLAQLADLRDGTPLKVCGIVLGLKTQTTKRGEVFARAMLEDFEGMLEVLVWPMALAPCKAWLKKDALVLVKGRLDLSGEEPKISAEELIDLESLPKAARALHLRSDAMDASATDLVHWIAEHPGSLPVHLHWIKGDRELVQKLPEARGLDPSVALEVPGKTEIWLDC
ncbi:MAG: DNA polymerase III subunit alpha [candidate division FCPU426 bacterium]